MVAALLVFTLLPLDASLPQAAAGPPLEVTLRAVDGGRTSTVEVVHRNVGRQPIVVYSGWSCGGPAFDRVYADGAPAPEIPPLLTPPPPCRNRTLVARRLAPGEAYAVSMNGASHFGDSRVYATFTVVDERGRTLRTLRSPTLSFNLWW